MSSNIRIQKLFSKLMLGKNLSESESLGLFKALFSDQLSEPDSKTLLVLLAQRPVTADELLGCVKALQKFEKPKGPKIKGLMDTCGTGGDGSHTLNISTLTSLVLAAGGVKIAKHGNRAMTSKSGSSDLMEAMGYDLSKKDPALFRSIQDSNFGYFHAPFHHPVFSKVQPLRKSLGIKTIFNYLGPLVNPMRLDYQLVGISDPNSLGLYANVLSHLPRKRALVCHSDDGLDEISTAAKTTGVLISNKKRRKIVIDPSKYSLQKAKPADLVIRSVGESKKMSFKILGGKDSSKATDVIKLNAACGLWVAEKVKTIDSGIKEAQKILSSGTALTLLHKVTGKK